MSSTSSVLLVGALSCVLMLGVLSSMLRTIPGIREWCAANALSGTALAAERLCTALDRTLIAMAGRPKSVAVRYTMSIGRGAWRLSCKT